MTVVLRPLRRTDFELLARWLAEPLVARWWNHETSAAAIERDFGASVDGRDATRMLIGAVTGRPFGLIQYYAIGAYPEYLAELCALCDVPPGALSMDYLIGEPRFRGRGLGAEMIGRCVEWAWSQDGEAGDVIVPVHAENSASRRALGRAGFTRIADGPLTPDNPGHSMHHYVYRLRRSERTVA